MKLICEQYIERSITKIDDSCFDVTVKRTTCLTFTNLWKFFHDATINLVYHSCFVNVVDVLENV